MEEIKVGEYVRTKKGEICKVLGVRQEQRTGKRVYGHLAYYLDNHKGSLTPAFIVIHSPNIIDLIEEDDIGIMRYNGLTFKKFITKDDILELKFKNYELLEIVTKEQFNQVKYEV